ncbi:hypothetical protein L3Q82_016574, partial [Scortum barcoo]
MTWAKAEKNCQSMGGNLASIHNIILEYHEIQRLVMSSSYEYKEAWIGGSDAQEENTWFWSDGKPFHYSKLVFLVSPITIAEGSIVYRSIME